MKKLYFLDEAEKNRILTLHESATKKQYLRESDEFEMEPEMMEGEIDEDAGLVGTALVMGPIGWAYSALNSGTAGEGARAIFSKCKTNKGKLGKRKQNDATLAQIADKINTAVEGMGTTLPSIKAAFQNVKSVADLCALSYVYQRRHGESLYNALDGDIDRNDEWKNNVYLPLLDNAVKNSEAEYKSLQAAATKKAQQEKELGPKAAKCGWVLKKPDGSTVPDVAGYRNSNWQCPKGSTSTTTQTTKKTSTQTTSKTNVASAPTSADFDKFLNS
jgi:hypothetical protein